jgi:peptide/nickel transport system permease protein
MGPFIARRVAMTALMLFLVVLTVFLLGHLSGDPVRLMVRDNASQAEQDALRATLGLDRPLYVQFVDYLAHALQGDLGQSLRYRESSLGLVLQRMPATVELSSAAMLLALAIALPAGLVAALRPGSWADALASLVSLIGQSMPAYWIGIILIVVFAVQLGWLPATGRSDLSSLVLPAVTLGLWPTARIARVLRSSLLEVLHDDFVRTARAKGLAEPRVVWAHALRNASIPMVTMAALTYANILGGTVVTESVFGWPGVGRLALEAVNNRDFPLLQATVLVTAVILVFISLGLDVLYVWLDPRIRLQ